MNILLLASHQVAEYDDIRMFTDLGYSVFSPGGYATPSEPTEDLRPPLPVQGFPDLVKLCNVQRMKHLTHGDDWAIDWAKADVHPEIIDWADVVIVHHFPERWIVGQWSNFRGKRVIWRTCGQSNPELERFIKPLRSIGLQIVRYSPAERRAFEPLGWAGEDALIRFGKYPEDFPEWMGDTVAVGNLTQDMKGRAAFCGYDFWQEATSGLPVRPAGAKSEEIGGIGKLTYAETFTYWQTMRAHLYTGTIPASYTLSLIEAMMGGCPTVSISKERMPLPALFEGDEIALPYEASELRDLLNDEGQARDASLFARETAERLFGVATIGPQWRAFLNG